MRATRRPGRSAIAILVAGLVLSGCTPAPEPTQISEAAGTLAPADVELPPTRGVFDYQLGGAYDEVDLGDGPVGIDVVVRDATAEPLEGAYSVCYVNGFQTQPGDSEMWLAHESLLLHDDEGALVIDPEWPDEYVLDPSTATQRDGILDILGPVVTGCADDGFDAVEIDNLDTWTRFDQIDEDGAFALAASYVELAQDSGMAIGQKNAAEVTEIARAELGFDFAITEECAVWEECAAYTDVYGDHVLHVEYPEALEEEELTFADACGLEDRAPLMILRDVELVPIGDAGYVYESCDDEAE